MITPARAQGPAIAATDGGAAVRAECVALAESTGDDAGVAVVRVDEVEGCKPPMQILSWHIQVSPFESRQVVAICVIKLSLAVEWLMWLILMLLDVAVVVTVVAGVKGSAPMEIEPIMLLRGMLEIDAELAIGSELLAVDDMMDSVDDICMDMELETGVRMIDEEIVTVIVLGLMTVFVFEAVASIIEGGGGVVGGSAVTGPTSQMVLLLSLEAVGCATLRGGVHLPEPPDCAEHNESEKLV
jgi:hypothetical protein